MRRIVSLAFSASAAVLALAALAAGPGVAAAQVAAMDLVPAAARFHHPNAVGINSATITPDNPAALAWSTDSAAAIGATSGSLVRPGLPQEDQAGRFYGARFVGDTWGLGLEYLAVDQITPPNNSYDRVANAQLSLKMGWLALGVGTEEVETEAGGAPFKAKRSGGGLSLRLWGSLYLGAARYWDDVRPPGAPVAEPRNIDMAGIAFRSKGTVQWYLAYDVIDQDPLPPQFGLKSHAYTVQMNAGGFLLGASVGSLDVYGPGTSQAPTIRTRTLDIGWAPNMGWSLTLRAHRFNVAPPLGGEEHDDTNSLALTRRF